MEKQREGSKRRVMVAIDESQYSYHALMWVLDNLKELITGSPLLIFAAQPFPDYNACGTLVHPGLYFPVSTTPPGLIRALQEKSRVVLSGVLEKAATICAGRGVKAETITEVGEPKEVICNAIQKYKIDLLVIGNNPVGILERAFRGSLSDHCLNNAKCHVLVVKKPE